MRPTPPCRMFACLSLICAILLVATPALAEPYAWRLATIKGGGYITGLYFHPRNAGVLYMRTDMGGAYRLDPTSHRWVPLLDWAGAQDYASLHGVSSIALDPADDNVVYLLTGMYTTSWGANGALLRSGDRGKTWTRTDLPFKVDGNMTGRWCAERLALDPNQPNHLLIGTAAGHLYRSADAGRTVTRVMSFPEVSKNTFGLVSLEFVGGKPGEPTQTVYAGVSRDGGGATVFKSVDGGNNWSPVPGGPGTEEKRFLYKTVKDREGNLLLVYNNAPDLNLGSAKPKQGWVYRLNTSDDTWTELMASKGHGIGAVAVDPRDAKVLMVTSLAKWSSNIDLWRSEDAGKSWKTIAVKRAGEPAYVTDGWPYPHWMTDIDIAPDDSDHVLISGVAGVYRTTAGTQPKQTWTFYNDGMEQCAINDLICPPGGATQVYSTTFDISGFKHDDLDVSPPNFAPDLDGSLDIDLAELAPEKMVRTATKAPHGAYSSDAGATWKAFKAPAGVTGGGRVCITADGAAIVWSPGGAATAFRSTDGGQSWSPVVGVPKDSVLAADRKNPEVVYAYAPNDGKLYRSRDRGASFGVVPVELEPRCRVLVIHPQVEGDLWLGGEKGLFHSTDSGQTWSRVAGVTGARALSMGRSKQDGGYPALYLAGAVGSAKGVFRSDDAGATWAEISDPAHQFGLVQAIAGDMRKFGRVYLGTNGRGVFYGDPQP